MFGVVGAGAREGEEEEEVGRQDGGGESHSILRGTVKVQYLTEERFGKF